MIVDFKQTPELQEQTEIKGTLLTHELQTLKRLFYDTLNINVPKDIMQDIDYAKVNIAQILTHYIFKNWNNETFSLKEKLAICKFCEEWYYFKTAVKDVCRNCYVKEIEGKKSLEVERW